MRRMRTIVLVGMLAGVGLPLAREAAAQTAGTCVAGTSFSQKALSTGGSKVTIKRNIRSGDADADEWGGAINPCAYGGVDTPWLMSFQLDQVGGGAPFWDEFVSVPDFSNCLDNGKGLQKGSLNDANCKIKFAMKYDVNSGAWLSGSFSEQCITALPVAQLTDASAAFTVDNGNTDVMKFFTPASGCASPAVVSKDGSDGKSVKMKTGTIASCSSC